MYKIFLESNHDYNEIEYLLDKTFGHSRYGLSAYRLREGVEPIKELSYVVKDEFLVIIGSIRFWPILIGKKNYKALLLGPLGVHPIRQGEGIGRFLINHSLKMAKGFGWRRVVLIGDFEYYSRFGFSQSVLNDIKFIYNKNDKRLLGKELLHGSFNRVKGSIKKFK